MIANRNFKNRLWKGVLLLILFALALLANRGYASEKYALLVGVSNYPSLPENRQLQGAKNDVLMMRGVLGNMGFQNANIHLLADRVEGATTPTRKAILEALNQLQNKSSSGDFVYLHFSGHGSQQPILSKLLAAHETDGVDEIFLPTDIGKWDGKTGSVKNAIIDDEFDAAINSIRKKGVFVWAVFDTCHAGTLNRGGRDTTEYTREVTPLELGIPAKLMAKSQHNRRGLTVKHDDGTLNDKPDTNFNALGGYIGFYASQSDQITTEAKFKVDDHLVTHGTFTFALAQAISTKPKLSYRELSQEILNQYATHNRFFPTPLFEGNQLDAQIWDESKTKQQNQWPLQRNVYGEISIPIGSLHQINEDSLFALTENSDVNTETSKVYFKVQSVSALNTVLNAIDPKTHLGLPAYPIATGSYARLIRPGLQKRITIAFNEKHFPPMLLTSLKRREQQKNAEINWIKKSIDSASDFELISANQSMCLLVVGMPQTCKSKIAWLPISQNFEKNIQTITERAVHLRKVNNLLLVAEQFSALENLEKFDIQLHLTPKNSTKNFLMDRTKWAQVKAGDKLTIVMKNNTTRSIDASLLFVNSAHNIQAIFPDQQGEVNRIEPQGRYEIKLDITPETLGSEKLIAILAEARPHSMMQNFSFLADTTPMRINRGEDNAFNSGLSVLFFDPIFTNFSEPNKEITRGADNHKTVASISSQSAIRIFNWIVK